MNNQLKEGELFLKYKSSYQSALKDLSIHLWFFCYAFYFMWYLKNSWLSVFPTCFLGLLLHRNYVVFHDCCHNSYTPSKTLNYLIGTFYGITTFTSTNWILDHHTHHLTNGNLENTYNFKFNELLYYNVGQYKKFNTRSKNIFKFFHTPAVFFSFFPILYFVIIQRFIYFIKKIKYNKKIDASIFQVSYDHVINNLGISVLLIEVYKYNILYHFLLASFIGFVINFLLFFNQHTYNPAYVVTNKEWSQRNSGLLGSSFIQIPNYLKYFTMGIEYHHIHHMNAKIPGYNLQNFHEEVVLKSNLFDNIIKLSITDCYNNLWLMLYDETKKKYVTVKEIDDEILKESIQQCD
jgi:omega-6 fatty acid desaturase (delta-12 desaturase)